MSYDQGNRWVARGAATTIGIDAGLRQYMLRVYNYMAAGLALTGVVAYAVAAGGFVPTIYGTPLFWLVMLAPFGFVLVLSFGIQRLSLGTAQLVFWAFAAVMGLSLSAIFLRYTGTSIARVFFISAGTFAATSLYGYTTQRDLTGVGSFMYMGLWGLIISGVVNWWLQSPMIYFVTSIVGVIVFVGLTAYDTQRIKELYVESDGDVIAGKKAIMGALALYLDFINLFLYMLRFLGDRRS